MVAETSLFRVPQLLEKMTPFCVLIGAMTCYLALSRRLELVVARAAGVSAWQFISPALACALAARHPCDHGLQSDVRQPARTVQADGGRTVRWRLGRGTAGRIRFLDQSGDERGPGHHQRRAQRAARRPPDRADRVQVRSRLPVQGANRGTRGRLWRTAAGCSKVFAGLRSTAPRSSRKPLSSRPA